MNRRVRNASPMMVLTPSDAQPRSARTNSLMSFASKCSATTAFAGLAILDDRYSCVLHAILAALSNA